MREGWAEHPWFRASEERDRLHPRREEEVIAGDLRRRQSSTLPNAPHVGYGAGFRVFPSDGLE